MTHINNALVNMCRDLEAVKVDLKRLATRAPEPMKGSVEELAKQAECVIEIAHGKMELKVGMQVSQIYMGYGTITNVSQHRKHVTVRWKRPTGDTLSTYHVFSLNYL